jgi:hypothetical protein
MMSQDEQIKELLDQWAREPLDIPESWWDEFETFLKANRLNLEVRDLYLE